VRGRGRECSALLKALEQMSGGSCGPVEGGRVSDFHFAG
jgi:hypothetical protein